MTQQKPPDDDSGDRGYSVEAYLFGIAGGFSMLSVGVMGLVVAFHEATSWNYALIGMTHPLMLAGYVTYTVGGAFLARHGWKQAVQSDANGGQASAA